MRNNYFTKLIRYINKAYHLDKKIEHTVDKRVNPTYPTSQIVSVVLIGFLLRMTSFNQLNMMIKTGEFDKVVRGIIPKVYV